MDWKEIKVGDFGHTKIRITLTPYIIGEVFWSKMTKEDNGKEYKAYINSKKIGEFPEKKDAMECVEVEINKIINYIKNTKSSE